MTKEISNALEAVQKAFSFPEYIDYTQYACANIATTVLRHVPIGLRILDFGSGPCDKTATLSVLGYCCSAIDDLNDEWHLEPGNLEKILSFPPEVDRTRSRIYEARLGIPRRNDGPPVLRIEGVRPLLSEGSI